MPNNIKYKVGEVYTVNDGDLIILERVETNTKNRYVKIKWLDDFGYVQNVRVDTLKTGSIRNPYQRTVEETGYFGVGVHKSTEIRKYDSWHNMIIRCYNKKVKEKYPTYENCYSVDSWHCYQTYADFYESCPYRKDGWNLDKDLLVPGNKVYSPETCVYLPPSINNKLFYCSTRNQFGLRGVWYDEECSKWRAIVAPSIDKRTIIGYFDSKEEANAAALSAEGEFYYRLAEDWEGKLDPRAIQGLVNLAKHRKGLILI